MKVPASTFAPGTIAGTLWPAATVLFLGGALLISQTKTNDGLRTEVAKATADNLALARLRIENVQLARVVASLTVPPVRASSPPVAAPPVTEPAPRRIAASVTINPNGTIAWNDDVVSLAGFLAQLRELQAGGDAESRVLIRGMGAEFPALTYVIDEVRKAGLNHVTVESTAKPDPNVRPVWFWF
jgi:biopolymer transport protein ExbD